MNKIWGSSLLFIGALLLSGCENKYAQQKTATPSLTSTDNTKQIDDASTWETSKSKYDDFEIRHPKDWTFIKSSTGQELEFTRELGHSIGIVYHKNLADVNPQYASLADYMASPGFQEASAIKFKGDDGFTANMAQTIGSESFTQNFMIVQHNDHIYVISYISDPEYRDIKRQIVDTLTFLN